MKRHCRRAPQERTACSLDERGDFVSRYVRPHRPLLISGAMSDWPAMMDASRGRGDEEQAAGRGRWDLSVAAGRAHFQRMLEAAGPLHVEISKDGPTFYGDERFGEEAKMTSRGFARLVEEELLIRQSAPKVGEEEERHLYLNQCPLYPPPSPSTTAPSLLDDIRLPSFLLPCLRHPSPTSSSSTSSSSSSCATSSIPFPSPAEAPSLLPALHSANLWVSAGGTSSNVHYDCFPNLLCVVHGSKRVALWPPAATPHLRPHPVYGKATNHSRLNVDLPTAPCACAVMCVRVRVRVRSTLTMRAAGARGRHGGRGRVAAAAHGHRGPPWPDALHS